jgi:hypothetical protein
MQIVHCRARAAARFTAAPQSEQHIDADPTQMEISATPRIMGLAHPPAVFNTAHSAVRNR